MAEHDLVLGDTPTPLQNSRGEFAFEFTLGCGGCAWSKLVAVSDPTTERTEVAFAEAWIEHDAARDRRSVSPR